MANVNDTLEQRKNVHGNYALSAPMKDDIIYRLQNTPNFDDMDAVGRTTLRMIIEKIGRIMYGDWSFVDHWHDIAGYATLMQNHCEDLHNAKASNKD